MNDAAVDHEPSDAQVVLGVRVRKRIVLTRFNLRRRHHDELLAFAFELASDDASEHSRCPILQRPSETALAADFAVLPAVSGFLCPSTPADNAVVFRPDVVTVFQNHIGKRFMGCLSFCRQLSSEFGNPVKHPEAPIAFLKTDPLDEGTVFVKRVRVVQSQRSADFLLHPGDLGFNLLQSDVRCQRNDCR